MSQPNRLYEWRTQGAENCPHCAYLAGRVLSLEAWQTLILPGFHPGCDCELVLVTTTQGENEPLLPPLPPEERFPRRGKVPRPRPRNPGPRPVMV
jgi:hypothetical protein